MDRVVYARFPPAPSLIAAAPVLIGLADGLFAAEGIDLELFVPPVHSWTSIAAGEADVGACHVAFCALPEHRGRMRAIAVHDRNTPGHGFTALLVRKQLLESGVVNDDPSSIAGRTIALLPGRADDYLAWWGLLQQGGLTFDDVEIVRVGHDGADREHALRSGSVDVVIGRGPRHRQEEINAGLVGLWKVGYEVAPDQQAQYLVANSTFVSERRDVATRWTRAYLEGARRYRAAYDLNQDRARVLGLLSTATGEAPDLLDHVTPGGFDADGDIDLIALERDLRVLADAELVPAGTGPDELVDTGIVAAAKIGRPTLA